MEQELGALMRKVESLQLAVAEVSQASPASKARAETVVRRLDFLENGLQEVVPVLGKVNEDEEAMKSLAQEIAELRQVQDTCTAQVTQLLTVAKREDATALVSDLQEEFAAIVCKMETSHEEHSRLAQRVASVEANCPPRLDSLESAIQGWSEQLQANSGKQQEAIEGLLSQLKALETHLSGHVATWEAERQKEVQAALSEKMDCMEQEHGWLKEQLRVGLEAQELAVAVKDEKISDLEGTLHWLREQLESIQQLQHESKSLQKEQAGLDYLAMRVQAVEEVQLLKMPELGVISTRLGTLEAKLGHSRAVSTRAQCVEEQAQDSKFEQISQHKLEEAEAEAWLVGSSHAAQVAPSPEWTDGTDDARDQEQPDRHAPEHRGENAKSVLLSSRGGTAASTPDHHRFATCRAHDCSASWSGGLTDEAGPNAEGIDGGPHLSAATIRESLVRLGLLHDQRSTRDRQPF